MNFYKIKENPRFIGRNLEWARLTKIHALKESSIVVVHGRRRIGKTELIEQFFRSENVLKFEGLQIPPKSDSSKKQSLRQIDECLRILGHYVGQELLFKNIKCQNWSEFFEVLTPYVSEGSVVLYFEELQWLCAFEDEFLTRLKPFWDNKWRHNNNLRIIFSGSSPSFLARQFMSDKALYNRSTSIISLAPFSLHEIDLYLGKMGYREKMIAAFCLGGIPEYLKQIKYGPSVLESIYSESFTKNGFFLDEYSKIFVSNFSENSYYKDTIKALCTEKFLSRNQLVTKISQSKNLGGNFTKILEDLEACGFIESYSPLQLAESRNLIRYCIADEYLNFYQNFVMPVEKKIRNGDFENNPKSAINQNKFYSIMGLTFERWCRRNHHIIAKILGFHKVEYTSGSFFNRAINEQLAGFQIDLMFIRRDEKLMLAEIKYGEIPANIKSEIQKKIDLFLLHNSKFKNHTIETILICGSSQKLAPDQCDSFDHCIYLEDLFKAAAF